MNDLKKLEYGEGWQSVNEQFYDDIGVLEQRPLLHENFLEYLESIEDSQSIYKKRKPDSVWLSEDSHPSDKGHKLWANKLIKHIEKYGLME